MNDSSSRPRCVVPFLWTAQTPLMRLIQDVTLPWSLGKGIRLCVCACPRAANHFCSGASLADRQSLFLLERHTSVREPPLCLVLFFSSRVTYQQAGLLVVDNRNRETRRARSSQHQTRNLLPTLRCTVGPRVSRPHEREWEARPRRGCFSSLSSPTSTSPPPPPFPLEPPDAPSHITHWAPIRIA